MAIQIADGFQLRVAKPLDDRQNVETIAQLDPTYGYEGQIVYVKDIKRFYTCYKDDNGSLAYKVMETGSSTPNESAGIELWISGGIYEENDFVSYNDYIYRCKIANNDADFVEDNWEKQSDTHIEITEQEILDLLNLTDEELETMAQLIDDSIITTNKTHSSSKIYADIRQCLQDSKDFTLGELSKKIGASYKVVSSTSEMTSKDYLYLLSNGSSYDIYIVEEDSSATKIGNTTIDLSNYYTKSEVDNEFLKQVDADGKYATITTVDGKVDKDKIATVLDDSVTDDEVASAKAVYDVLENINDFSVQVVKENLDLNDMTETGIYFFPQTYTPVNIPVGVNGWLLVMKGSSSNIVKQVWYRQGTANANSYNTFERYKAGDTWSEWTKFLTEKDYYSALNSGNTNIPENADLNDYVTAGVYTCIHGDVAKTLVNCPHIASNFKLIVNKNRGNSDVFYGYQMIVGTVGYNPVKDVCIYYRGVVTSNDVCVFSKWKIMSGSTVANVPVTTITTSNLSSDKITAGAVSYCVKNGVCYVYLEGIKCSEVGTSISILENMPKALITSGAHAGKSSSEATLTQYCHIVKNGTTLQLHCYKADDTGYCSFSYPIAEE